MNEKDWTNLTDSDISSEEDHPDYSEGHPDGDENEEIYGNYNRPQYYENRGRRGGRGDYSSRGHRGHRRGGHDRSRGGGYRKGPRSHRELESQPKDVILGFLREGPDVDGYWLNIFNLEDDTNEEQIMEFYSGIPAVDIEVNRGNRLTIDVKFDTVQDISKAIDLGVKEINGNPFMIRSSNFLIN